MSTAAQYAITAKRERMIAYIRTLQSDHDVSNVMCTLNSLIHTINQEISRTNWRKKSNTLSQIDFTVK